MLFDVVVKVVLSDGNSGCGCDVDFVVMVMLGPRKQSQALCDSEDIIVSR